MNTTIHRPTEAEKKAAWEEFDSRQKQITTERKAVTLRARGALMRLTAVMQWRSGQPYKVREILFSLWNGKPCDMSEVLNLDWEIRKDLVCVISAFGFSDRTEEFFYDALKLAITQAGQWKWFIDEAQNVEKMRSYVAAIDRERGTR